MEKLMLMRSLCRSIIRSRSHHAFSAGGCSRSHHAFSAAVTAGAAVNNRHIHFYSSPFPATSPNHKDCQHPLAMRLGGTRSFSEDGSHMPDIKDPEIERAFKELMAINWDEIPASVVQVVKGALSKNTDDKEAQEILKNVFRAAEAVEEFTGILISLKMEMDDSVGMSGENVTPLSEEYVNAMRTIFDRYAAYLAAFGPEESYLKKKVETELGTKMIYLKMRCSGLGAEWGKVTVLGTSGISGSYIEHRA